MASLTKVTSAMLGLFFDTQALLEADEGLGYAADSVRQVSVDDVVFVLAEAIGYKVIAADAVSPDAETAGGVKLARISVDAETVIASLAAEQADWNAGIIDVEATLTPTKLEAAVRYRRQRIVFEDRKASGTNGGSSTATTWVTRVLNTEVENTITGASLVANVITLPAAEYRLDEALAPAYEVGGHQCRLWDNDASAVLALGTSNYAGGSTVSASKATGRFTLTAETDLILQHWCETNKLTNGLGVAISSGAGEVYSRVVITRLGDYIP